MFEATTNTKPPLETAEDYLPSTYQVEKPQTTKPPSESSRKRKQPIARLKRG
jgi:hypothetical protein